MTKLDLEMASRDQNTGSPRRRRWRRWVIAGVGLPIALVALVVVLVKPQPGPPPLALPTAGAAASVAGGEIDGGWRVGAGSVAGFRIRQTVFGRSGDIVGRTKTVTGTATASGNQVTSATFRLDLTSIKVNGKAQPQFAKSLDTQNFPDASFTLGQPITLPPEVDTGATVSVTATGQFTLHGATRPVTIAVTGRRNGAALEAVGSIPITFSEWGIKPATNYGPIGSLADHGVAEFLLVLNRR